MFASDWLMAVSSIFLATDCIIHSEWPSLMGVRSINSPSPQCQKICSISDGFISQTWHYVLNIRSFFLQNVITIELRAFPVSLNSIFGKKKIFEGITAYQANMQKQQHYLKFFLCQAVIRDPI